MIEAFTPPAGPSPSRSVLRPPAGPWAPLHPRVGDYSRTRFFESRVAFDGQAEDTEKIATPTRRFSLLEITNVLPHDPWKADERTEAQRLRDVRARVKAAQATVTTTPGLAQTIHRDCRRAAGFYARLNISEAMSRHGVPVGWM
jgi:hypothetical protein